MAQVPDTDVSTVSVGGSAYTVPFIYQNRSEVFVEVDGVSTAFTWINDGNISITPAPAAGAIVRRYRNTSALQIRHDYRNGVPFTPKNIAENNDQLLFVVQESVNDTADTAALALATSEQALATAQDALDFVGERTQYMVLGPYGPGLEFQTTSQVFSYGGEFYAPGPAITLPYTTTGVGAAEIANFRSVGDATLRSDLASGAPDKGAAIIGRGAQIVATIAELRMLLKTSPSKYAEVLEYSAGAGVVNSQYVIDPTDTTTADNGFTVIVAGDGGRWKLKHAGPYTLKMAGGKEDGVTDDADAWDRLLAVSQGKAVEFSGVSITGRSIVVPVNNLRLRGTTKAAIIKAKDGTNFEYTFRAVSKSGLELHGFTVDSNKAGRVGVLTTRTISIGLESCTDCQLTECAGINAVGSASIPGVGISTAGVGLRVNTTNCTAKDCGYVGKAADGFFCSSSQSVNTGNVAISCLDTGHVLESCSYSGIVGCVSINCGVVGAITNAIAADTYGNYINGLRGHDWAASVTGGVQIAALAAGNLLETEVSGLSLVGVASFVGPGINVRRTSTGRVDGLTIDASVRNGSAQGILIDSALNVTISARVAGTTSACIQVMGDSDKVSISGRTQLTGGTYGVTCQGTSKVHVAGVQMSSPSSYGLYAFDTSTITSTFNDVTTPGVAYEGKDAGATLHRVTQIAGQLSFNNIAVGAPLSAVSKKTTVVDSTGNIAGVIGLSLA